MNTPAYYAFCAWLIAYGFGATDKLPPIAVASITVLLAIVAIRALSRYNGRTTPEQQT